MRLLQTAIVQNLFPNKAIFQENNPKNIDQGMQLFPG